jgi:transcriptional regulator with XRE-family HTH domain
MKIGDRIGKLRTEKGMSQTALAKTVGSSSAMISLIEANKNKPTLELLENLTAFFEVSADYLLTGKEEQNLRRNPFSEEEEQVIDLYRKDPDLKEALKKVLNTKKKAISYLGNYTAASQNAAMS